MSIKLGTLSQTKTQLQSDLISAAVEMSSLTDQIHEGFGHLEEVDAVMTNLDFCISALKKSDDQNATIKLLDLGTSLENLIGIDPSKITAKAATEGLSEGLKKAWKAFKELCSKIWNAIKNIFSKTGPQKAEAVKEKVKAAEEKIKTAEKEEPKPSKENSQKKTKSIINYKHKLATPLKVYAENLDVLMKFLTEMEPIAVESDKKVHDILKNNDTEAAAKYAEWLESKLRATKNGNLRYEWEIDNVNGDGHIRIKYTAGMNRDGSATCIYNAGIQNASDRNKVLTCVDVIKRILHTLDGMDDVSNYMQDTWSDSYNVKHIPEKPDNGMMSVKAAVKMHLRFFGLLGNTIINQQLEMITHLTRAMTESIEEVEV